MPTSTSGANAHRDAEVGRAQDEERLAEARERERAARGHDDPERLAQALEQRAVESHASAFPGACSGSCTPKTTSRKQRIAGITATQKTARKSSFHASIEPHRHQRPRDGSSVSNVWRNPNAAPRMDGGVRSAMSASRGAPRMPLPMRSAKRAVKHEERSGGDGEERLGERRQSVADRR
jgi:hypothetical protein